MKFYIRGARLTKAGYTVRMRARFGADDQVYSELIVALPAAEAAELGMEPGAARFAEWFKERLADADVTFVSPEQFEDDVEGGWWGDGWSVGRGEVPS